MNDDPFLSSLRVVWKAQSTSPDEIARAFARHRRWARLFMVANLLGVALIILGLMALVLLTRPGALVFIAILAFVVALAVAVIDIVRLRDRLRIRFEETPGGVLRQAINRNATLQQGIRGARHAAIILAVAAAGALITAATRLTAYETALSIATLWGVSAACIWFWQIRRGRRLTAESLSLDAILLQIEKPVS
jgi:hypothetical protein